ncbi:MAG: Mut7-C RNAse domain-containing protein [Halobaculum sp.]
MLGKLATYLRMCGHDAAYALDRGVEADDRLRVLADREDRRLLTRDEALADRTPGAILLTERAVTDQLRELDAAGVDLRLAARPARCGRCNGPVELAAEPSDASPDSTDLPDTPDPSDTPDPPNGPTDSADTSDSPDRDRPEYVPGDVRAWRCLDCGQWFWKGSHWDRVAETLAAVRE